MRIVFKLALVLVGVAALGGAGWHALHYQPFLAAPEAVELPAVRGVGPEAPRAAAIEVVDQDRIKPYLAIVTRGIETPPPTQTKNFLLCGVDTRPEFHGGRTDALIVFMLHEESGHVGLVSIPRDLLVAVPGGELNRINTVYAEGLRQGGARRGVELLKEVIQHTLGLPIAHVAFVEHAGFEALVDSLGGLTLDVICPIEDNFLDPRGPGGRMRLSLETGLQHLDGKTALMYARSRHGRGIFDRARRQQAVLMGLRQRLSELGLDGVRTLLPALEKTLFTDLEVKDLLPLATRLLRIKPEQIHGLVMGPAEAEPIIMEDGRWVMVPNYEGITRALAGLFQAKAPGLQDPRTCPPADVALHEKPYRAPKTPRPDAGLGSGG